MYLTIQDFNPHPSQHSTQLTYVDQFFYCAAFVLLLLNCFMSLRSFCTESPTLSTLTSSSFHQCSLWWVCFAPLSNWLLARKSRVLDQFLIKQEDIELVLIAIIIPNMYDIPTADTELLFIFNLFYRSYDYCHFKVGGNVTSFSHIFHA